MQGRMTGRYAVLAFLVMTLVVTTGDSVGACSCIGTPVCGIDSREPAEGAVIFIGTAVSVKYPLIRFTVERVLVGPSATELTLGPLAGRAAYNDPPIVTSCDRGFTANERYLVYASRLPETGDLVTSQCSRTRPASDPQALADVMYFEARAAGRSAVGWLSGTVQERHYDSSRDSDGQVRGVITRPLSGIRMTATSPEGLVRSTTTDASGVFIFEGLKPSQNPPWRLKADLPKPFAPHDGSVSPQFHVPPHGVLWFRNGTCAEANIVARVDGRIAGRVLDERGRPARGVVMELANAAALSTDEWASADETTVSNDDGRFEFRPLPEGRYYIGVAFDQRGYEGTLDRRRYYPGVRELSQAKAVSLRRGERLQLESFRLPPLPETRTLTVVLKAPSPEVAARAGVFLTGAVKERVNLASGSVVLRLPYGAAYELSVQPPGGYFASYESTPRPSSGISLFGREETDRTITITLQPVRR